MVSPPISAASLRASDSSSSWIGWSRLAKMPTRSEVCAWVRPFASQLATSAGFATRTA